MTKINKGKTEFIKGLLITVLIMMACFLLLDLYVPIKRVLMGDNLNISEILSYIKLKQHIPIVIAVSVALEFGRNRKNNKVGNKID